VFNINIYRQGIPFKITGIKGPSISSGMFVLRGRSVEITGLSWQEGQVFFWLHKFLCVNHLSGYGVLDTGGQVS